MFKFFFVFLGVFHFCNADFYLCTVASIPHRRLNMLKFSCRKNNMPIHVLGMGLPYANNTSKIGYALDFIEKLNDSDIVMFVDAYDVLVLSSADEILEKFRTFNLPIVISVEKNCCPKDFIQAFHETKTSFK